MRGTLRARLVVTMLLLLAVAGAGIGVVTTLALHEFLVDRLDEDLMTSGQIVRRLPPPDESGLAPLPGTRYRTGDTVKRDADGWYSFVGRNDDVFKSSDYRISPFELESVLIEHPAVAEAAVVPAPDVLRLAVPKAYITLTASGKPDRATALSIFQHLKGRLAPFKRIRRLEFAELPKTISGKIRRVELRRDEEKRAAANQRGPGEFREEDFPELTS